MKWHLDLMRIVLIIVFRYQNPRVNKNKFNAVGGNNVSHIASIQTASSSSIDKQVANVVPFHLLPPTTLMLYLKPLDFNIKTQLFATILRGFM